MAPARATGSGGYCGDEFAELLSVFPALIVGAAAGKAVLCVEVCAASPSDITLEVIRKVMSMNAAQLLELKEYISGKFNE